MERVTRDGGAPFELVAGIESRHKGLRHLELRQHRGRGGYSPTGLTYVVKHDGRLAEHDERPDDSAEEIAAQIWTDAQKQHSDAGGNREFQLLCYTAKKEGGAAKGEVRFSLDDSDVSSADSPAQIEALARSSFTEELREYVKLMHKRDDERSKASTDLFVNFAKGAEALFKVVTDTVIPNVLEMRLDALEDRAEAYEVGAGGDPKRQRWTRQTTANTSSTSTTKELAEGLKAFLGGPMGQVGLARAMGVPKEELAKYLETQFGSGAAPAAAANSAPAGEIDIRPTVKKLYFALAAAQREQIKTELGEPWVKAVSDAGLADSSTAATVAIKRALDGMSEAQFDALQRILNPQQQAIIDELFMQLEKIASSAPTSA